MTLWSNSQHPKTIWSWLQRLANRPPTSGSLAKNGIKTIRVDVNSIQLSKFGWFTDIVNKANADGAHITIEVNAGDQLVNPSAYLAQTITHITQSISTSSNQCSAAKGVYWTFIRSINECIYCTIFWQKLLIAWHGTKAQFHSSYVFYKYLISWFIYFKIESIFD